MIVTNSTYRLIRNLKNDMAPMQVLSLLQPTAVFFLLFFLWSFQPPVWQVTDPGKENTKQSHSIHCWKCGFSCLEKPHFFTKRRIAFLRRVRSNRNYQYIQIKQKNPKDIGFLLYPSGFIFVWRLPIFAFTLSSAFNGLTSVFEMGTGVTHWLSSPYSSLNQRILGWLFNVGFGFSIPWNTVGWFS